MILYAPDGMPYEVPASEVTSFIRSGFRSVNPNEPAETLSVQPIGDHHETLDLDNTRISVNSANLKDLASLPQVGTAIAKQIRDLRPYASVEDLIARIPGVEWLDLLPHLMFEGLSNAPVG